jgi:hypothetical protein
MSIVAGLLNQTITTMSSTTVDGYGALTKTTVYSGVKCRWQEKFQSVLDSQGQEVLSRIQVWLPDTHSNSTVSIDINYIFLYNSVEYTVIAYSDHFNTLGEREYIKVFLR